MKNAYVWRNISQTLTLESFFQPDQKYCFLAGSGISLNPPSNLPTGYQFTKTLLQELLPETDKQTILELMNPDREEKQNEGDFLRFEQLLGYLRDSFDPELHALDIYAECTTPNSIHHFLAEAITAGHQVFTTNFDNLIEYALLEQQVPNSQIYPMIYKTDWEQDNVLKRTHNMVYKLHGSLKNIITNANTHDSLQATLEQIAKEKKEIFSLEPWKDQILRQSLQDKPLIILGYSGLDNFDILPALWAIKSPQPIIWIAHEPNRTIKNGIIESVQQTNENIGIVNNDTFIRIHSHLLHFVENNTRDIEKIFIIRVHTTGLINLLSKLFHFQQRIPVVDTTFIHKQQSSPVIPKLKENEKFFLIGQIYADRNLPSISLNAYTKALAISKDTNDQSIIGQCLTSIGSSLYNQGRLDEALDYYQQALALAEQLDDYRGKAARLNNIGSLLYDQGRSSEALNYFQQALTITEQLDDLKSKSIQLSNIGNLLEGHGRLVEALDYYQQALAIAGQLGDLKGKATCLTNIGNLLYGQGRIDKALDCFQQALAIAEQLGDLKGKAIRLSNIGLLLGHQGRLVEALDYYQQALALDEQLGDIKNKAAHLSNIGSLLYKQGHSAKALEYYQQALALDERLNNIKGKSVDLSNIGTILLEQGHLTKALEYYQQVLTLIEQLGDIKTKASLSNNIGSLLESQGHLTEALQYYQQALAMAEQLNDIRTKAYCLNNIGSVLKLQGHSNEVLSYYQQALTIFKDLKAVREIEILEKKISAINKELECSEKKSG